MRSGELQTPFFFGGSQAPTALKIPASAYSGSSGAGVFSKGTPSLTKIGKLDFTTKKGDKVFTIDRCKIEIYYVESVKFHRKPDYDAYGDLSIKF